MSDKENTSKILRNKLLDEINRYETVVGDLASSSIMQGVPETLNKRIHGVIHQIKDVYEQYDSDQLNRFNQDYPHLEPVITELSKYQVNDKGEFAIEDLRALGAKVPRVEVTATSQKPHKHKLLNNPFK